MKIDFKKKNELKICTICYDKKACALIMPCGHGGLCYKCAISIWQNIGECPLCRKAISEVY